MNKKIILTVFTLIYCTHSVNAYNENPSHAGYTVIGQKEYEELTQEKKRQIQFLEESLKQNEASETGLTKTNIGLSTVFLGIVSVVAGIHYQKSALSIGGGLAIGTGGFIAHTASSSRRKSEKQARDKLAEATKNWDDLRLRIKVEKN
jgi:hypothetical protein